MGKEDFLRQVEIAKQQVLDERLQEELQTRQAKLSAEAVKREEEAAKQRLGAQRIEETRRNFAGTNIVETLEYIRDNNILVYHRNYDYRKVYRGFSIFSTEKTITTITAEPAALHYGINSIELIFDYFHGDAKEGEPSTYQSIYVKKNNQQIQLKYSGYYYDKITDITSENPNDIVAGIARVVALQPKI